MTGIDWPEVQNFKIELENLPGFTFVGQHEEYAYKMTVREQVEDGSEKYFVDIGTDGREAIMTYNEILNEINKKWNLDETEGNERWIFKNILNHRKNLHGKVEVLVLWDDESETWEPMKVFAEDDPITLASYAKENDLLDTPG